ALLIDLFEPRLEPALTESSARDIAATLARSIVVAMKASPVLRAPFLEVHEAQTRAMAQDVYALLRSFGELKDELARAPGGSRDRSGLVPGWRDHRG
ncbi:MAG: hypothetical protein GXP47_09060, partial [Acidobacteria bacterium]|nr:hypothetical protein [Acidobacteriota bacterium]